MPPIDRAIVLPVIEIGLKVQIGSCKKFSTCNLTVIHSGLTQRPSGTCDLFFFIQYVNWTTARNPPANVPRKVEDAIKDGVAAGSKSKGQVDSAGATRHVGGEGGKCF